MKYLTLRVKNAEYMKVKHFELNNETVFYFFFDTPALRL